MPRKSTANVKSYQLRVLELLEAEVQYRMQSTCAMEGHEGNCVCENIEIAVVVITCIYLPLTNHAALGTHAQGESFLAFV